MEKLDSSFRILLRLVVQNKGKARANDIKFQVSKGWFLNFKKIQFAW